MNPQKRAIILSLTALAIFVATLAYIIHESIALESWGLSQEETTASNLNFFVLININIIVVMVLVFLVIKNIVKLVLDRRRNILGARLRTRLVVAFVGLSLVPTVLLLFVAKGILESVLQGWFSPQIALSIDSALGIGRHYYASAERQLEHQVSQTSLRLAQFYPLLADEEKPSREQFEKLQDLISYFLEEKRYEYGLFELAVVDENGVVIARAMDKDNTAALEEQISLNLSAVNAATKGTLIVRPEQSFDVEVLRAYSPLVVGTHYNNNSFDVSFTKEDESASLGASRTLPFAVVGTLWIPPQLSEMLGSVLDTFDDYKELKTYRRPLASTYVLALIGFTLMIVFAAIWVGFYLARSLTGPIQALAQGTQEIAHGNLSHQIPEVGDDELSILVRSFNQMTGDLRNITGELVEKRRYIETVLTHVGVGVISIGANRRIVTFNIAAGDILGYSDVGQLVGRPIEEVLPDELVQSMGTALKDLSERENRVLTENVSLCVAGSSRHIRLTATRLSDLDDELNDDLGNVFLIDDLTELVSAQRTAAWREVARRIAHEIKNPLTPIQLSAERLQRKLLLSNPQGEGLSADSALVSECTETIMQQVETLRRLVNEFSRFAQMPKSTPSSTDINKVISDVSQLGRQTYADLEIETKLDPSVRERMFDSEQLRRGIMNLVDNAAAAIYEFRERQKSGSLRPLNGAASSAGKILISSRVDSKSGVIYIEVADDGVGVRDADKAKVFEPYFTTRRGGTGLGLAIVSAIVSDHQGFIRVKDNEPRGACVVMEFPLPVEPKQISA